MTPLRLLLARALDIKGLLWYPGGSAVMTGVVNAASSPRGGAAGGMVSSLLMRRSRGATIAAAATTTTGLVTRLFHPSHWDALLARMMPATPVTMVSFTLAAAAVAILTCNWLTSVPMTRGRAAQRGGSGARILSGKDEPVVLARRLRSLGLQPVPLPPGQAVDDLTPDEVLCEYMGRLARVAASASVLWHRRRRPVVCVMVRALGDTGFMMVASDHPQSDVQRAVQTGALDVAVIIGTGCGGALDVGHWVSAYADTVRRRVHVVDTLRPQAPAAYWDRLLTCCGADLPGELAQWPRVTHPQFRQGPLTCGPWSAYLLTALTFDHGGLRRHTPEYDRGYHGTTAETGGEEDAHASMVALHGRDSNQREGGEWSDAQILQFWGEVVVATTIPRRRKIKSLTVMNNGTPTGYPHSGRCG